MILRLSFIFLSTIFSFFSLAQSNLLKSPEEFLQYKYGSRFTPHHLIVDYFYHIAEASDKVNVVEYGKSYELRPMIAAHISSPQNLQRLEEIRLNNLKRARMSPGGSEADDIAIVYLSYSVHGNEAAAAESSMAVLYSLVKANPEAEKWLKNTIVIIDPCHNPDGYERYVQWNNSVSHFPYTTNLESREHNEPWPGGRFNHYYFDLNRDWAWQTQKETRNKVAHYHHWMPHVYVDIHEMRRQGTYYFAPASAPYNEHISPWQVSFQQVIGKNNASYFDKNGWSYFTKEEYDLFYPSYGDSYTMLSGSIGMTYEQSGSSPAGRAYIQANGDTLKLIDRIAHHQTASLSTIEVASKNALNLVKEFEMYFKNASGKSAGVFKNYIVSQDNNAGRIHDLIDLLEKNKITYGTLPSDINGSRGYNYTTSATGNFNAQKGDLIIPVSQPRASLVNALFEPESNLTDSATYDITAWSIPMAYGLKAFATTEHLDIKPFSIKKPASLQMSGSPYGYAFGWGSVFSTKLLAAYQSRGIVARYATNEFKLNGIDYETGTIVLLRADNRNHPGFDHIVKEVSLSSVIPITALTTGYVESGKDLGSDSYMLINRPQVLTFAGGDIFPFNTGQIWHFFEEELQYPLTIIETEQADDITLSNYNIIIFPEGTYHLSNEFLEEVTDWARAGGRIIAIGSAMNFFADKGDFSLKKKSNTNESTKPVDDDGHFPEAFNSKTRKAISNKISGAVFKTRMDQTHPLSFGLGETYWSLKNSTGSYAWLPDGGNALYLDDKLSYVGFAGSKAIQSLPRSLIAGSEEIGEGSIVYFVDDPLFRSFWNSGKVLFSNAIFF